MSSLSEEQDASKPIRTFFRWPSLGSVLVLSLPIWIVRLALGLHFDNELYQVMARDFYVYGKLPYLGTWDSNFPGILLVHLCSIVLFGPSNMGLLCFDVLIQIGFLIVFYRLLTRWLSQETVAIAVLLYALYYVNGCPGLSIQRDVYGMMATIAAYFLLTEAFVPRWKRVVGFIIAGLLIGLAVAIRPTSLAYLAILCCYLLSERGIRTIHGWAAALGFGLLGLVPLGSFLIWYCAIPHGLEAFYNATIRFNLDLYTKLSFGLSEITLAIINTKLLFPLTIYGLLLATFHRKRLNGLVRHSLQRRDQILVILSIVSALAILILQQKFFKYHFAPFFILVIPFAALAVVDLTNRASARLRPILLVVLILATNVLWLRGPGQIIHAIESIGKPDIGQTIATYMDRPGNQSREVEICSFDPTLRLRMNRPCVGPHIIFQALGFRTVPDSIGLQFYTDYQRRWKREYIDTLRAHMPGFILIDRGSSLQYLPDIYESTLRYVPGFDSLLQASYRYDTTIVGVNIFRRRNSL